MKKVISLLLLLVLAVTMISGCKNESAYIPAPDSAPRQSQTDTIDAIIVKIKNDLRIGDFKTAYGSAARSEFVSFIEKQTRSEYYSNDGFSAAKGENNGVMVIFLDVTNGLSADTVNGFEYFFSSDYLAEDTSTGTPERLLRCVKAEVALGKYTGFYEEYWYKVSSWGMFMSENGTIVNGGYEGSVTTHFENGNSETVTYKNGYDGVNMNPEDRMPFPAGDDGPDVSHLTVWNKSGSDSSTVAQQSEPEPPTPEAVVETINISNENQLRAAVANAGSNPILAILTEDVELISDFIVPGGVSITFTSEEGGAEFSLIASRYMNVITVLENATLTINGIGVTSKEGGLGVHNNGTFILEKGTISNCIGNNRDSKTDGGGGGVYNGGTFIMNGGLISGNNAEGWYGRGGGVGNNGIFNMNGGSIINNTARGDGGGVYNDGTFNMNDGIIGENIASGSVGWGGGGGVDNGGIFNLTGGVIRGNSTGRDGYGGGVRNRNFFNMSGGTICDNVSTARGGGIYNLTGFFYMQNGEISNNKSQNGGGVSNRSDFTMNDGIIVGNTATSTGGGVDIYDNHSKPGTFIMNAGSIVGNTADWGGGGVSNAEGHSERGVFTMNGGTISGNAAGKGAGVLNNSTFSMSSGTIHNNEAVENGGGLNHMGGEFIFDGGWIYDNAAGASADIEISGTFHNNVYDNKVGAIGSSPP